VLVVCGVAAGVAPVAGQTATRLSDKDVKGLLEAVDNSRDRFEDQLDSDLRHSTFKGPLGEVNVSRSLDDFQQAVKKLRERFTPQYSAGVEVGAVLQQAASIDQFLKERGEGTKGSAEWKQLVADLTKLAEAYKTRFPMPPDATIRRMNDADVAGAANSLAANADRLKGELGRDTAMAAADREQAGRELDVVKKQANTVRSRAQDGKPATAEARELVTAVGRVANMLAGRTLSQQATNALGSMRGAVQKLQDAFGIVDPEGTR
jgi:hypothetical protein